MTLILPYPPSTNTAYAVRNGRKIKTTKAREYATQVEWIAKHAANLADIEPEAGTRVTPAQFFAERLAVTITVHPPDRRRRDLANTEKLAIDAVFAALGLDDSQIDRLTLERAPIDRKNPRLVVTLEAIA